MEYEKSRKQLYSFWKESFFFLSLNSYPQSTIYKRVNTKNHIVKSMDFYKSKQGWSLARLESILSLWLHVSREIYS